MRILIIGIGNPLRCDDGIGWTLAQQLSGEFTRDDVRVLATHQLTPEIAELISRAERVLFIDAACSGDPGEVKLRKVAAATPSHRISHELSPEEVVALSEKLYGHVPAAYVLTVAGESFGTGDQLSARVRTSLPTLTAQVNQFIVDSLR